MPRTKLSPDQTEYLRRRLLEDQAAIAAWDTARDRLASARSAREQAIAEHDAAVAEADADLAETTRTLVSRLGADGAQALGAELPAEPSRRRRNGSRP